MTLHGLSDRFLAAVADTHTAVSQVLVRAPNGDVEDITGFVTPTPGANGVSVDESREIRRQLSLTPAGDPDLVPADASDLLHPSSGNELVVSRGVKYPDGTTELAPLGVFRLTKPAFNDNGAISAKITGNDRAARVAAIDWQAPFVTPAGSNVGAAIRAGMDTRLPGLDYSGFQDIEFSFPDTTWGADPSQAGDPMQDFITFAANAAAELFFDPIGNPILRPIINPLTSQIVDGVSFVEGDNCVMTSTGRTLDETTGRNGVRLFCNGIGAVAPFVVTVWDTDPASATFYKGIWGQRPLKMTTTAIPSGADTQTQAEAKGLTMAYGQLQLILGCFDDVTMTAQPNAALREGDCVAVTRSRLGVAGGYVMSNFTMPLDSATSMPVGFRPRVQAR